MQILTRSPSLSLSRTFSAGLRYALPGTAIALKSHLLRTMGLIARNILFKA